MAGSKLIQILIELQSDTAIKELSALRAALAEFNTAGKTAAAATKEVSRSLLEAARSVAAAKVTVQRFSVDLSAMGRQSSTVAKTLTVLQAGLFRVGAAIKAAGAGVANGVAKLKQYNMQLLYSKNASEQAASSTNLLRRAMIALGGVVILRNAVRTIREFEQEISIVQGITHATGGEFEALQRRALELGRTTRFTATQAAGGLAEFARAGLDVTDSIDLLDDALNLAQVGQLDVADAVKTTVTAMSVFEIETGRASEVMDALTIASTRSLTSVSEMTEAFKFSAQAAKTEGLSLELLTAVLAGLAKSGLKASTAGTSFTTALSLLAKPSDEAKAKLAILQINLKDIDVSSRGLIPVLETLRGKVSDLGTATLLAGQRGGRALLSAIQQVDFIKETAASYQGLSGETKRLAEVMDQNLNGALLRLKSAWEAIILTTTENTKVGQEFQLVIDEIATALRAVGFEGSTFSELLAKGLRGAAFAVAIVRDSFRGLALVWQTLKGAWGILAEYVQEGISLIDLGLLGARATFLKLNVVFFKLGEVFTKTVNKIKTLLSDLLGTFGDVLDQINAFSDAAVPDDLIGGLFKLRKELVAGQLEQNTFAKEAVRAAKIQVDQINKLIAKRLEQKSAGVLAARAIQNESAAEIVRLSSEESAVDKLVAKIQTLANERLRAAEAAANKPPAPEAPPPPPPGPDGPAAGPDLARIQARQETLKFLSEIEISAAQDLQEKLAAMDKQAQEEANLRAQERGAELQLKFEQGLITEKQYLEARKQINLAAENELAEIRIAGAERVLTATQSSLEGLERAFGTFYELSGKQAKEFVIAQRAVSVALTLIKTYEAAQSAYAAGAVISPVLGGAMAAIAVAEGLARAAIIGAQGLADGGFVEGHSPTTTSDNIHARLTAGEYVHPVKTVSYYGGGVMEAIRQRSIPREVLSSYRQPSRAPSHRFAFQAGGAVGTQAARSAAPDAGQPTSIVNLVGDAQFEQFLASRPGQKMVLNVLSNNPFQARQAMRQR